MKTNIWITASGVRLPIEMALGAKDGALADGECPECGFAYNRHHLCECGECGSYSREQDDEDEDNDDYDEQLRAIEANQRARRHLRQLREPWETAPAFSSKLAWVKPLLFALFGYGKAAVKPIPRLSVWAAQLATIFYVVLHAVPTDPFAGMEWAADLPEGIEWNYVAASVATLVFCLWTRFVVGSQPGPVGVGKAR